MGTIHDKSNMDFTWDYSSKGTSDIEGYGDNTTYCAITDDTNSSLLQVQPQHHRTYSNESSGPISDGPCHSEPSDFRPEHIYGNVSDWDAIHQIGHSAFLPDLLNPGLSYLELVIVTC